MKSTYIEIIDEIKGTKTIQRTDPDGKIWSIPVDESNSDYQAYLNPVEHLTEIPPQATQSRPMVIDDPKS